MILLDIGHALIKDYFASGLLRDTQCADFDDVLYVLRCDEDFGSINIHIPSFPTLLEYGAHQYLTSIYGDLLCPGESIGGITYNVSLKFSMTEPRTDEFWEKLSMLKRHCLAAPFHHIFRQVIAEKSENLITIPYRRDENLYIKSTREGSIIVIFQIKFREQNDLVIADVFMKDFSEVRRDPSLSQAPSIGFSKTAPLELRGLTVNEGNDIAFISFVLFARHYTGDKAERSISSLINFRNELHYHIKCAKAYLHTRMRQRVSNLLQVLNRAKPEAVGAAKKTSTGRTFVRK